MLLLSQVDFLARIPEGDCTCRAFFGFNEDGGHIGDLPTSSTYLASCEPQTCPNTVLVQTFCILLVSKGRTTLQKCEPFEVLLYVHGVYVVPFNHPTIIVQFTEPGNDSPTQTRRKSRSGNRNCMKVTSFHDTGMR